MILDLDMFLLFRHDTAVALNPSLSYNASGCIPVRRVIVVLDDDRWVSGFPLNC